jgi:uncharacterized protein YyaL (SSP411 family)
MMIAALAEAAMVFDRTDWLALAQTGFAAARQALSLKPTNQHNDQHYELCHSARNGRRLHVSLAQDYAFFGQAATALYRATGDAAYLDEAVFCADKLDTDFWDTKLGGYRARPHHQDTDALVNARAHQDNAAPSANAAAHRLLSELALLTGQAAYAQRAEDLFASLSGHLAKGFSAMTALLDSQQSSLAPLSIIIIQPNTGETSLARAAQTHPIANRLIMVLSDTAHLAKDHPAAGKTALHNSPTAYICPGQNCLAPINQPSELIAQLDALMRKRHISS